MLGLIKKDLLLINKNLNTFLLMLVVYGIISLDGTFNITYIIPFITITLFISTFSYDDFNNWHSYASSFPSGRVNIVKSKYIVGLIIITISILIALFMTTITTIISAHPLNLELIMSESVGILLAVIILFSIMCPLIFKFGTEKGRIWLFILIFGFAIIIGICSKFLNLNDFCSPFKITDEIFYISVPAFLIITLLASYTLSKKIYLRKEF